MTNFFRRAALPLGWYYAVTLVLPLLNGAGHSGAAFAKHAAVVLVVPPLMLLAAYVVYRVARLSLVK